MVEYFQRAHGASILYRKTKFEGLLGEYQTEVDTFREREVSRNVEEIQATIKQLDRLAQNLEAAKEEAMVRGAGCML